MTTRSQKNHELLLLQARIHRSSNASSALNGTWIHAVAGPCNLEAAWSRVRQSDGCNTPGVDGQTRSDIDGQSAAWLDRIREELTRGNYRPQAVRWIDVPKSRPAINTLITPRREVGTLSMRRIGILTLRDRVVHAALKQILEPILEKHFYDNSFGFRPGRSVAAAVDRAAQMLSSNGPRSYYPWTVRLDVADCFDTIQHQPLLQTLTTHIPDQALMKLLRDLLTAGGTCARVGWIPFLRRNVMQGLVQGSPLSPLLCNAYLNDLDHCLAAEQRACGDYVLLRYADDMLLLAVSRAAAHRAVALIKRQLSSIGLRLKRSKCATSQSHLGVEWLGLCLAPRTRQQAWRRRLEYGYNIPDEKVGNLLARIEEMTVPPSTRIDVQTFDLSRWLVSLNTQLRQWRQAYLYADDGPEVFHIIDDYIQVRVAQLLRLLTGNSMRDVRRHYRIRLSRGFFTWQINGCRLIVLSLLAPHRPHRLIRPPDWTRASLLAREESAATGPVRSTPALTTTEIPS